MIDTTNKGHDLTVSQGPLLLHPGKTTDSTAAFLADN